MEIFKDLVFKNEAQLQRVFNCNVSLPLYYMHAGKSFKKVAKKPTKRHRTAYTKDQIARLESSFAVQPYPDLMLRQEIAESLALTEHKICVSPRTNLFCA